MQRLPLCDVALELAGDPYWRPGSSRAGRRVERLLAIVIVADDAAAVMRLREGHIFLLRIDFPHHHPAGLCVIVGLDLRLPYWSALLHWEAALWSAYCSLNS